MHKSEETSQTSDVAVSKHELTRVIYKFIPTLACIIAGYVGL